MDGGLGFTNMQLKLQAAMVWDSGLRRDLHGFVWFMVVSHTQLPCPLVPQNDPGGYLGKARDSRMSSKGQLDLHWGHCALGQGKLNTSVDPSANPVNTFCLVRKSTLEIRILILENGQRR